MNDGILWSTKIATEPTAEPITVAEARDQLHYVDSDEDTYISGLIVAARELVEGPMNRAFVTQTWDMFLASFPGEIELPYSPLSSVTSVKHLDADGTQQTLTVTTDYQVDTNSEPGRVLLAWNKSWPTIRPDQPASVEVRFVAGYGAASAVPDSIKHQLRFIVAHWFENRVPLGPALKEMTPAITALFQRDRVQVFV